MYVQQSILLHNLILELLIKLQNAAENILQITHLYTNKINTLHSLPNYMHSLINLTYTGKFSSTSRKLCDTHLIASNTAPKQCGNWEWPIFFNTILQKHTMFAGLNSVSQHAIILGCCGWRKVGSISMIVYGNFSPIFLYSRLNISHHHESNLSSAIHTVIGILFII